jgi:hypothetical protein
MGLFDLFRPKWKHSDPDVRIAAAGKITDENILIEMAGNDREWFVRHNAFDILRSRNCGQHVYAALARHARDEEIRRKAIKKLTDQAVLQEVATSDKYRYIRDAAEHRLEELRQNLWGEVGQVQSAG